jgi:7-keto-8-aminopelargonate synthetase-like enzyme
MGTLSKAFASAGGFIAAPRVLIEYLRYSCPGFVFSAGMPPASAAAALAAIELLEAEPERVTTLRARSMQFRQRCAEAGIVVGESMDESGMRLALDTPIIPIITGSPERTVALAAQLESRGVLAAPMLPPAVPEGAARVRFFVTASHTEAQIEAAVRVLAESMRAGEDVGN